MTDADKDKIMKIAVRVAPLFFADGAEKIYASLCCARIFFGREKPEKCNTCKQTPEILVINKSDVCS